jgi:hypothetical protein
MATPPDFTDATALAASSLNSIGLWKTASVTLTGQTTASLTNAFTSDYSNYLFVYNVRTNTGTTAMRVQLAINGTPNATAGSYIVGGRFVGYPGVGAADFNAADPYFGFSFMATFPNNGHVTISNPFDTTPTSITGNYSSNNAMVVVGGYHNQSVSYNGLYITNSATAALFGQFSVYGMKK